MADEGILTQYTITKDFIKGGRLNVGKSVLASIANKGQNNRQRSVHEQGKDELCIFYSRNIL